MKHALYLTIPAAPIQRFATNHHILQYDGAALEWEGIFEFWSVFP